MPGNVLRHTRNREPMLIAPLLLLSMAGAPAPVIIHSSAGNEYRQPQVVVEGKQVDLTFGAQGKIFFVKSPDGGLHFGNPLEIASVAKMDLGRHRGPRIARAGKGTGHHFRCDRPENGMDGRSGCLEIGGRRENMVCACAGKRPSGRSAGGLARPCFERDRPSGRCLARSSGPSEKATRCRDATLFLHLD